MSRSAYSSGVTAGCHQPLQQRVLRGNRPEEPLLAAQMGLIWSREYER